MNIKNIFTIFFLIIGIHFQAFAQDSTSNNTGWLSLGARSTVSAFSEPGVGIGTGGQFRIQLSNRVNTDWFADYFNIHDNEVISEYFHIGWSVLFYPFKNLVFPKHTIQPFILAGHCFDYNKKTVLPFIVNYTDKQISKDRWGSAVQTGIGTHFNLSERFDITLMTQYMIHLTKSLELEYENGIYTIGEHQHTTLEGHLLTTVSVNYKLFKLWKK